MLPANDNLLIKLCSVCLIVTILFTLQNASFAWDTNLNPQLHIVIIMDTPDGINPLSLSIKKGDTVGWYNQGLEPVTIKFTAPLGIVCSPLINFTIEPGEFSVVELPAFALCRMASLNTRCEESLKRVIKSRMKR
jgi:hypothetical protein